jgi:hypothetical protein
MSQMMHRGILFDVEGRAALVNRIQGEVYELQGRLDELANISRPTLDDVASTVCYSAKLGKVKSWGDITIYAKPSWQVPLGSSMKSPEEEK